MSNPTELLCCPFCGNKPTMVEWTASAPEIRCDPCGIVMDGLREEVIGAWNRRARPEDEAPQAVQVAHEGIITEGGNLVCTACGTTTERAAAPASGDISQSAPEAHVVQSEKAAATSAGEQ